MTKACCQEILNFCEEIVFACPAYDLVSDAIFDVKDVFENFIQIKEHIHLIS